RAALARLEGGLGVQRSDARALGVVEHGMVRRPRRVVVRILRRAPDVDAVGILGERGDAHAVHARMRRVHRCLMGTPSSGLSATHTLSRTLVCAAATGWMRSG